ncbi:MAG: DnaA regulatory inactivator Hda [Gammaproteobacteria bacterium]|nr:DnaA regulatory inactivator Hda [Gammaproteobacteria bacterium]
MATEAPHGGVDSGARVTIQLTLPIGLRAAPTFTSFVVGVNAEACHWVEAVAHGTGPDTVYLWGAAGVGKTHLLEAACREVAGRGERVGFVPLAQRERLLPAMLVGLETASLVCVDDLSVASGALDWEQALFHLMNGLRAHDGRLLLAGRNPPAALGLRLPDLASRVGAALALRLAPPTDADRAEALRRQARDRGFVLPEDVVAYLLRRFPRDLPSLLAQLDRLDAGSLEARRRVTLPLVRELLDKR